MEQHLLAGGKAGGGLGALVNGFIDSGRVAEQMGEGMVGAPPIDANAAMMAQTMAAEGAAHMGVFGGPQMGGELDVADFLATSAQYAAEEAAFAQMDAAAMQMGGPSVADFAGFQQGQAVEDFMAFQQMQGPSVDDFAAFQQAQGPSAADFAAFQQAQGPSVADFAAFQQAQGPSIINYAAFQQMQGPSAADFVTFQQAQGPSAADFGRFQQMQGPSVADFEAFQQSQGPSVADFQAFQQSQGPSVADFKAFQQQVSAAEGRFATLMKSNSDQAWDAALADALATESLGLSELNEPLATMCAANEIPAQLIHLEARLRLTQHMESGMDPQAIHELLQLEIDRLVLMNFAERWPQHRQQERAGLMALLIEQQLQIKLGLDTQLQFHRGAGGKVAVTNPANGMQVQHGFTPLEGAELQQLVGTELTMHCRGVFMQQTPMVTLRGPPGTGKVETLVDVCRHIIGQPVHRLDCKDVRSAADVQPMFELMNAGVFVICDSAEKLDPRLAAELVPALTAHAQAVHARNVSAGVGAGPALAWCYQHSTAEAIDSQLDAPSVDSNAITQLNAITGSDPLQTVEMRRPDVSEIARVMLAKESFTRYETLTQLLMAINCCCTNVGDNDLRLRCLDEVDTSPDATIVNGQHLGMRQLRATIDTAGRRLRETGGAGDPAAEVDAFWRGLASSGVLTMLKEHEARKVLAMAMDHVQQDSQTAAMLMSAGFPEPKQLSHMESLFQCQRHGVLLSQLPRPEAEAAVQQVAEARGATTNIIELSAGSDEEVVAALASAFQATPEGMPQVIAVGGAPLSDDAWEALHQLLDDNKKLVLNSGDAIPLPEGTQIIFLAESLMHEPRTAASGSRLAVFQLGEAMTYIEAQLEFTSMVDLALSRPEAATSLEQLRENMMQRSQRLILRSRTGLSKPERTALQNQIIILQDNMRTIEQLQQAGTATADVWNNTLKHYEVAPAGAGGAVSPEVAAAEQQLHTVMAAVRPKHRGLAAARASGDPAAVAAAEADLFAAVPFVNDARNAVAAARAATMHVVAEVSGFSHTVDVEAAAVIGSHYSTDYEILIRNRLTRENHQKYFQAKAQGKVFASSGRAGSGKTETIKDIERALGVEPIVLQTSDDMSLVDALGTLPEGSVVIFDEFNRLNPEQMAEAFRLREQRGLMMSITWNPGYAGRSKVPPELLEQCIMQEMVPPRQDPELELELYRGLLARFGFLQCNELAPRLIALFHKMEVQCKKENHYDFGLRFQMAVLRKAGKFLALDPSLDETELLALSILQPLWAKCDDADRGVVLQLLVETFGSSPTVPDSWTVVGPAGKAAMMGSVLESRHGAMMLWDDTRSADSPRGSSWMALAALREEASARGAELVVLDFKRDGPEWETRFADALRDASVGGRRVWLTVDVTHVEWDESWGFSPTPSFWENLNSLLDDNKKLPTSAGETISLGAGARVVFVAPASVPANMSPASISRLGIVNALGESM
jgi:hypothetical protein